MASHSPFTLLFVCTGNVCRSAFAERLAVARIADIPTLKDVAVESAGTHAWVGQPIDSHSAAELRSRGGDPEGKVGQRLSPAIVERASLVLTATREHRSLLLTESPGALKRTFTLLEFAHLANGLVADSREALVAEAARTRSRAAIEEYDIADPIGQSTELHASVAEVTAHAVDQVLAALAANSVR